MIHGKAETIHVIKNKTSTSTKAGTETGL